MGGRGYIFSIINENTEYFFFILSTVPLDLIWPLSVIVATLSLIFETYAKENQNNLQKEI